MPYFDKGYPWCADVGVMAAGFLLFGRFFDILGQRIKGYGLSLVCVLGGALGTFTFLFNSVDLNSNGYVLMAKRYIGNPVLFLITAVSGCVMVYGIARILELAKFEFKILKYIGKNTLAIFAVHKPLIEIMEKVFMKVPMHWLIELIICTVVVLGISCLLSTVINYFAPVLNGKAGK